MPSLEPCDLHEVGNCSICTGIDKQHVASLEEPTYDRGVAPRIPGGPTILSRFHGYCSGCGRRYEPGDAIHLDRELWDGWVGVECCVTGTKTVRDRGVPL